MEATQKLMSGLSPEALALIKRTQTRKSATAEKGSAIPPLMKRGEGPYSLSFAQQRLWVLDRLMPGLAVYHIPLTMRLRGRLDRQALRSALDALLERHETLRTTFSAAADGPVQIIGAPQPVEIEEADLSALPESEREMAMRDFLAAQMRRPFDLGRDAMLRASLAQLGAGDHALQLVVHHIAADGWSMGILRRDFVSLYQAAAKLGPKLDPPGLQYADFSQWQRKWLNGGEMDRQLAFWRDRLAGAPSSLDMPTDHPRPTALSYRGARRSVMLPAKLADGLRALGRSQGATLFMTMLSGFAALLSRYSGQTDLVIGTPIANRNRAELEGIIGFFVNSLALRVNAGEAPSFAELVSRVRAECLGAYAHQDLPFERLVSELKPDRELGRSPVFQVMFAVQNAPGGALRIPGLEIEPIRYPSETAKFDLSMSITERPEGLRATIEFSTDLFDATTIERMLGHYESLLESAVVEPSRNISALAMMCGRERQALEVSWAQSQCDYGAPECVHEAVARQAKLRPDATAAEFGEHSMSYAELEARSAALARKLRRLGVGPDVCVALCVSRSLRLPVAVLGALKAGGAYVPLDPSYPADRLAWMLDDAKPAVLVTEPGLADFLPSHSIPTLLLDDKGELEGDAESYEQDLTDCDVTPDNLAYVIYTSGSTGRPKGVAMTHLALWNLLAWQARETTVGAGSRTLQYSALGFDVSFQELLTTLWGGGTLVLVSEDDRRDPKLLLEQITRHQVDRLFLPFVALQQLAEWSASRPDLLPKLREVVTAGEQLRITPALERFALGAGLSLLHNQYGPTETHVVTAQRLQGDPAQWPKLPPIGMAIGNVGAYVLDARLEPVPAGVPGELYIGGPALARGYLGRPALTAEKFVPNPFSGKPGARMYRTGDRARIRNDGTLEYLGRLDEQVKIRGHRIEPGEVEAVLESHEAVRAAAVAARSVASGMMLAAYVVLKDGVESWSRHEASLREHLKRSLPAPVVPSSITVLDQLPTTPSGKVDRRALPEPAATSIASERILPRTATEEIVAGIWGEVLGLSEVGIDDDFFELGGHSLSATQVISRIYNALGAELALRTLFEGPTVAALAVASEAAKRGPQSHSLGEGPSPRASDAPCPLSFAQQRMWVIDRLMPGTPAYHIPLPLRLRGELDIAALKLALDGLLERHEALRTTFAPNADGPIQVVNPPCSVEIEQVDLSMHRESEREPTLREFLIAQMRKPFDLGRDAMLRASLAKLDREEYALQLVVHHIAADGWSMGILRRDLVALYQAAIGKGAAPAGPRLQYADFSQWQRTWLNDCGEMDRQLDYWRGRLDGAPAWLDLPTDHPRPSTLSYHGARRAVVLSPELAEGLRTLSRSQGATLFMTMLSGFAALLSRYSGQTDLVIGTPIANRNRAELEGIIGFFVNSLALRVHAGEDPTFTELVGRVRAECLGAYAHQDLPFERLVSELKPDRELGRSPVFQVMFAVQNAPGGSLQIPGLEIEPIRYPSETAKFDLSMSITERPEGLRASLEYSTDLFDAQTIERILVHYVTLLESAIAEPSLRVSALALMSADERRALEESWTASAREFERREWVHEAVSRRAALQPDAIAVETVTRSMTYAALDDRSTALASRLRSLGVGSGSLVGIFMDRSLEMLAGIFGVLKVGAAYVPLDPSYPADRIAFMLADTQAPVVLTQRSLALQLPASGAKVIFVDEEWEALGRSLSDEEKVGLPVSIEAGQLAYVIYTSGSTGRPKGVMISHESLANHMAWMNEAFPMTSSDAVLQKTPFSFDASVWEFYAPLMTGARLVMADPQKHRDALYMISAVNRHKITVLQVVPTMLGMLLDTGKLASCESLRRMFAGGEALTLELRNRFHAVSRANLINLYGPTETTIEVTSFTCRQDDDVSRIPIGTPVSNVGAYVLDERLEPVPAGVPGELYIGGPAVARGYLGRRALTAEKFVPDPFCSAPGARMYRTGDRARLCNDGTLEYLGRLDEQLKIRGHRIEPGEVEAVLEAHGSVRSAAVAARPSGAGMTLAAYVVLKDGAETWPRYEASLREHLKRSLPAQAVPSSITVLDSLPTTPSGKVDRRALPDPAMSVEHTARVRPRTATEEIVAGIWSEVLGLSEVGVDEDFFDLGGHSLNAAAALVKINGLTGMSLPLTLFFEGATVEHIARLIDKGVDAREMPTLIEIRRGGEKTPLFLVSAPRVNSLGYVFLARHLHPGRQIYGLQRHHRTVANGPYTQDEYEDTASSYLKAMKEVQPNGPYLIAGFCEGAHIAFEVCRQLEQLGEEGRLAVFDTWCVENTRNYFLFRCHSFYRYRIRPILRKLTGRGRSKPKAAMPKAAVATEKSAAKEVSKRDRAKQGPSPWLARYFPGRDFVPLVFRGRAIVFKVARQPFYRIRDPLMGWGTRALGGVAVQVVPGVHGTILREPHVQVLARKFEESMCAFETD